MANPNDPDKDASDTYKLNAAVGIALAAIALGGFAWVLNQSNSVSGTDIVLLFAMLLVFLTFVYLTALSANRTRGPIAVPELLKNLVFSLATGLLTNLLYDLFKGQT